GLSVLLTGVAAPALRGCRAGAASDLAAAGAASGRRGRDARLRGGGIHRPGVAGRRRVGVAGRIGRAYLEAVAAVGQAAIALRAHAGCEGTRVELTGEAAAGLGGGEAEAGDRESVAWGRRGRDGGGGRGGIHRPGGAGR